MKIHFLTDPMPHHASYSGYGRLMDFMRHSTMPASRQWKAMSEEEKKLAFAKAKAAISWYEMRDLESEISVNSLTPRFRKHICHFLYGENSIYHIQKSRTKKKKIFVTFHQPPSAHQEFVRTRKPLKNIDGIIVVGTNQIPFFSQYVDKSKIIYIPHGIDTDFFQPVDWPNRDPQKCLFVGNWLRDFATLNRVAEIVGKDEKEIIIDVVTLERNRALVEGIPNIRFHSGIPEDDLLSKYQSASLLLMPLRDSTANNSILEGMACGLPVVTTDIGGIKDYVDGKCAVLCKPDDAECMAEAVTALLKDTGRLEMMGMCARQKAEEFSWPLIAKVIYNAYLKVFTMRGIND